MAPRVLIYRDRLLPPSETFILQQAEALRRFTPVYLGAQAVRGLPTPAERTFVVHPRDERSLAGVAFRLVGTAPRLFRALERLQPQLVHAHFGPDGVQALGVARRLRCPLVVTFHGYDVTVRDEYLQQSYTQRRFLRCKFQLGERAGLLVAISRFIRSAMIERGFPENKIRVHYIGVDTERFKARSGQEREPIVLFVGRLVEKKGCGHLIRAMARVQARLPAVELVVIGDGPLRQELEAQARTLGLRHRFLGVQAPENVQAWLERARVFSVPSIVGSSGDAEGLGIVFLEAQAMGVPVVSFDTGGISEAVKHERTGLLAPAHDDELLAEYLCRLLQDDAMWRAFSVAGRQHVTGNFDLATQTRQLEELYLEVLDRA
ncbi:glycosyltransferase [Aggregicoccus sp. 17bor-14]|nr:glycosyltransferase [Simulacricoccus sp. 17bor-14]MRI88534.1 glycosyltransferase [Aggregicoccus sp. 17bor-14]